MARVSWQLLNELAQPLPVRERLALIWSLVQTLWGMRTLVLAGQSPLSLELGA